VVLLLAACVGLTPVPGRDSGAVGHDPGTDTAAGNPFDTNTEGNRPPVADAGSDGSGPVGVAFTVDGSASRDPDGDPITYQWNFSSRPSGSTSTIANATRSTAQFLPDVPGQFVLSLAVSDGLATGTDEVVIEAVSDNEGPVANAGADQKVTAGDTVMLDGSGSSDPDGDVLQFTWTMTTRPGGSAASLQRSTSANPTFTADVIGLYEISLTVSDGNDTSAPDSVRVTAADGDGGSGGSSGCGCRAASVGEVVVGIVAFGIVGLAPRGRRRR
jgi:hypothetical protein